MSIKQLDKNIDLWIGTSWFNNGVKNTMGHGICGHTFEIIEYYWKLKDHINCKMLWTEYFPNWEQLDIAIRAKYNFTEKEIKILKENSIFVEAPKMITGTNFLMVDGEIKRLRNSVLSFKNIIMFSCGEKDLHKLKDNRYTILQDNRIYEEGNNTKHYIKKILFNRFKIPATLDNKTFLYLTSNCRTLSNDTFDKILNNYKNDNIILGTDRPEIYSKYKDNVEIVKMPLQNMNERFNKFIYTPIDRKWDCSNRMIPECLYLKKEVIVDVDGDYFLDDTALKIRLDDIKKYSISCIDLSKDKEIVNIIKGIIC